MALVAITDRAFGTAGTPGAGSPVYGYKLLIADRGNNRLLLIDDKGQVSYGGTPRTVLPLRPAVSISRMTPSIFVTARPLSPTRKRTTR